MPIEEEPIGARPLGLVDQISRAGHRLIEAEEYDVNVV
jgi:hypothetical protein